MAKFIPRFENQSTKVNDSKEENPGLTPSDDAEALTQPQALTEATPSTDTVTEPDEAVQSPAQRLSGRQLLGRLKSVATQLAKLHRDKPLYRRSWFWISLGVGSSLFALGWVWLALEQSVPDTKGILTLVRDDTLTIKAADDTILQQQGPATREQLKLKQMPKQLTQAFLASEDRRFYQHHGVDYQGIIRAFFSNIQAREVVEGGSTITQQLARILFLDQERSLWRKLKEVRLSQKIEDKLSKEQILERYLNLVYLGSGAYGVADASWVYFSKPINKLSLPEMATIAGLAPAPSLYSPTANVEAARERRNLVLQRMREDKVITAAEAEAASQAPLTVNPSLPKRLQVTAPYFTTYIQQELPKYISPEVLEAGGLTVETSLNPKWQKVAEAAVKETVARNGRWQHFEQASLVSVDPRSGEIRAMVGGKDFSKNQFNRVTQAQRQPGSTFKGFVYTTAIATGINPTNGYLDAPFKVDGYEPKNFDRNYRGWLSMRDALTKSVNVIAVRVLIDVGFEPTIKLAHQMGIKSELKPTYSLALGSSEVNLLELTSAYGTLATQGMHTEVHGIRRIINKRGDVLYLAKYKPKRVLDSGSTAIMTWMLKNVVEAGTGRPAQLNRPVAGKTGTSDEARDLWFIGYIPQLVTGVWLGNDDNDPTWGSSGTAAYTWHEFMKQAVQGMPVEKFPERPKLEGRKGSIKAQPLKPRRVFIGPIPSKDTDNDSSRIGAEDSSDRNRSSRRRRYQQIEDAEQATTTRRRRRSRSYQQQADENSTPRRKRRSRRSRDEQTQNTDTSSQERRTRRRRRRATQETRSLESSPVRSSRRSKRSAAASETQQPATSWRERLRPSQPSTSAEP